MRRPVAITNASYVRDGDGIGDACDTPTGQGECTPAYWQNHLEDCAAAGYTPTADFDTVNLGGGVKMLARHGVAALLSAAHPGVDYPYSIAQVIAAVQAGDADTLAT